MIDRQECFIDVSAIPAEDLLDDWRWLIGDQAHKVVRGTAFGDLFLRDGTGRVLFLDTMEGKLKPFAQPEQDLDTMLDDRNVRRETLMPRLIEGLREAGNHLGLGQCYSPDVPPILGGQFDKENLKPTDVRVHVSLMGQIHRQVKDLPPGTRITDIQVEGSGPEGKDQPPSSP